MKRLELQEKDKTMQLKLRELEIREKELVIEYKAKEMELEKAKSKDPEASTVVDVGKHIHFVPPFQEVEADKYFMHFEKIAASLKWPEEIWTVLLQSVLIGKARKIYSALPVEQCARYAIVKESILKAYEIVPEAYRQKFRSTAKDSKQTFAEFAQEKERLFDRWCVSQNVDGNFAKLQQFLSVEEFKNCVSNELP